MRRGGKAKGGVTAKNLPRPQARPAGLRVTLTRRTAAVAFTAAQKQDTSAAAALTAEAVAT